MEKIERFHRKIPQAVFDPPAEVPSAITFDSLAWQAPARLRGDNDLLFAALLQLSEEPLAAAVAVHIRRVNEVHPAIHSFVEGGESVFVGDVAPGTAYSPRSKADLGYLPTCPAKWAVVHVRVILRKVYPRFRFAIESRARLFGEPELPLM